MSTPITWGATWVARWRATRKSVGTAAVVMMTSAVSLSAAGDSAEGKSAEGTSDRRMPSRCSTWIEDRNLAEFESYYEALTSGNFTAAVEYFAEDSVVEVHGSVPYAGTYEATAEYPAVAGQYWDPPESGPTEEPTLWADCDQVVLRGSFDQTATATDMSVDTSVIEIFTFDRAGKIARDDFYFTDTALVNKALGS
jgi:ketosteroid isomerase-like protein